MHAPAHSVPQRFPGRPGGIAQARPGGFKSNERGAALLAAVCFATVLAVALTSYLSLCYRTLELSGRSVQGMRSIELAESGLEEALWALNKNDWAGWTIAGANATKTVSGFTYDSGVTGSISLRVSGYDGSAGTRTLSATGTTTLPDGSSVSRTLTSTASKAPLFVNALAAVSSRVRFRSAGTVDSYDSSLGTYATQTPGFAAVVCSGSPSSSSATVQLNRAEVKGYVATLSTGPSYSTGARLTGPTTPVTTNIDSTRISTSPYQPLFDEVKPSGAGAPLFPGTTTIGLRGATTETLYYAADVDLTGSQVLTVDGPVVLVVAKDLAISDSASIRITVNGSLRVHVSGDISLNGAGIQNDTKLPKKLIIIATTNHYDSYGMATNTPFYGVIYTPFNSFTVSNSQDVFGAIVARSMTLSASPNIHYDVDLRRAVANGVATPFAVANVQEVGAP